MRVISSFVAPSRDLCAVATRPCSLASSTSCSAVRLASCPRIVTSKMR